MIWLKLRVSDFKVSSFEDEENTFFKSGNDFWEYRLTPFLKRYCSSLLISMYSYYRSRLYFGFLNFHFKLDLKLYRQIFSVSLFFSSCMTLVLKWTRKTEICFVSHISIYQTPPLVNSVRSFVDHSIYLAGQPVDCENELKRKNKNHIKINTANALTKISTYTSEKISTALWLLLEVLL